MLIERLYEVRVPHGRRGMLSNRSQKRPVVGLTTVRVGKLAASKVATSRRCACPRQLAEPKGSPAPARAGRCWTFSRT